MFILFRISYTPQMCSSLAAAAAAGADDDDDADQAQVQLAQLRRADPKSTQS
jgi:hypothetical protein